MGECGCASSDLDVAMMKIGEKYLVISIYPGCTDCFEGTGVLVKMLSQDGYDSYVDTRCIIDMGEVLKEDYDDICIPVVKWAEIGKAIDKEKFADIEEYDCFADFWHDNEEWVKDAARATVVNFCKKQDYNKT